jgi:predicted component of type VI protein secretion system
MSQGSVLKVRLSLKGRPIRTYTFSQKEILIGRDPESDIFLDNAGVSRTHARFELTPAGFVVEDLGSANGTFLNDELVAKKRIADDDIIRVGKFALWVNIGEDQRSKGPADKKPNANADEGTVVLSNTQIDRMMSAIRANEEEAALAPTPAPAPSIGPIRVPTAPAAYRKTLIWVASASFSLGAILAGFTVWIFS